MTLMVFMLIAGALFAVWSAAMIWLALPFVIL